MMEPACKHQPFRRQSETLIPSAKQVLFIQCFPTMTTNKRSSPAQEDICPSPLKKPRLQAPLSPQDCVLVAISATNSFLRACAVSTRKVLVPDRDPYGLCSSAIVSRILQWLGKSPEVALVHFVGKCSSFHSDKERAILDVFDAEWTVLWIRAIVQAGRRSA